MASHAADHTAWVSGWPTKAGPSTMTWANEMARARYMPRCTAHQVSRRTRRRMARIEMVPARHIRASPAVAVSMSGYRVSSTPTWCHRPVLAAWA